MPARRSFLRPRIHSPSVPSGIKWDFGEFDVSDDSSGSRCAELDDDDDLFREDAPPVDAYPATFTDSHMLLDADASLFLSHEPGGNHITASHSSLELPFSPDLSSPAHPVFHESNFWPMDQQMDAYEPYGFGAPADYGPDDLEALLRQHEAGSLAPSSMGEEDEVRDILN